MAERSFIPALRYNWLTKFYDFLLGITFPEKKIKHALIKQCMFNGNENLLDFGTGTATLSLLIKQQYPNISVTGIDVDGKILEIAREKGGSVIQLQQYDGSHIPFAENTFDKIISSLVFHHIPTTNKKVVLRELYRILRPGRELHIADFGKAKNLYTKLAFGIFRRMDGEENTRVNSRGLLPDYIQNAGFRNVEETRYFNTLFGTIKLIRAIKNEQPTLPNHSAV